MDGKAEERTTEEWVTENGVTRKQESSIDVLVSSVGTDVKEEA